MKRRREIMGSQGPKSINITYSYAQPTDTEHSTYTQGFNNWILAPETAKIGSTVTVSYSGNYDRNNIVTPPGTSTICRLQIKAQSASTYIVDITDTFEATFIVPAEDVEVYASNYSDTDSSCLVKGTKIRTITGVKNVEDITYEDLILTYDAYRGVVCYQHPCYIRPAGHSNQYLEITYDNDEQIKITNSHEFYDMNNHKVFDISLQNYQTLDYEKIRLMYCDEKNNIFPIQIKSVKLINQQVENYEILTSGTLCFFANNVLNAHCYLDFIGGFNENHIIPTFLVDQMDLLHLSFRDFCKEFEVLYEPLYNSCLLRYIGIGLLTNLHQYRQQSIDEYIKERTEVSDVDMAKNLVKAAINSFFNILTHYPDEKCYITFKFKNGDLITIQESLYEKINLPNNNKWYCIGDRQTYIKNTEVKMNTVFEEQ